MYTIVCKSVCICIYSTNASNIYRPHTVWLEIRIVDVHLWRGYQTYLTGSSSSSSSILCYVTVSSQLIRMETIILKALLL